MTEKVKKSIPWFLILALIGFAISVSFNFKTTEIKADSAAPATTVTVGNDAPEITVAAHEDPACHSGTGTAGTADNPVNQGINMDIKATATDANGDQYYLAVCSDPNPPVAADVADCEAPATTFGKSSLGTQGVEATVTFAAPTITSESEGWYVYACDSNTTNKCSAASQGTGNSGTPLYVNHRPTFGAVSDGAGDPGAADLTIEATTYDDGDTVAAQDTIRLYVCTTAAFTGGASPACTVATWCSQTTGQHGTTLSCDLTVPNPAAHGTDVQDYWPYIVDNHGFAATGGSQGSAEGYDVNDVAPTASSVSLNSGSAIDLSGGEKSTTDIYVTGTISDDNGCSDIVANNVKADAWQTTLTTRTGCDSAGEGAAPNNACYYHSSCVYDSVVEDCGAMPDKTGGYKCTVSFQYYTNPTDVSTPWPGDDWTATLIPGDELGENTAGEANSGVVELQSFLALGLTTGYTSIAYGAVAAGTNTDPLDELTRVEATGNVGLDVNLSGTTMTDTGTPIPIANQRYASGSTDPAWSEGTALSGSPTAFNLEVCKSGYTETPEWERIWWGIDIPEGQDPGEYSGTDTIEAVEDGWSGSNDWCEAP